MYRQDFPPRPRSVHQDQPGRQDPHHRRLRHPAPHRPAQVRAAVPRQHGRVQPRGLLVDIPMCFDVVVLGLRYLEKNNPRSRREDFTIHAKRRFHYINTPHMGCRGDFWIVTFVTESFRACLLILPFSRPCSANFSDNSTASHPTVSTANPCRCHPNNPGTPPLQVPSFQQRDRPAHTMHPPVPSPTSAPAPAHPRPTHSFAHFSPKNDKKDPSA